MARQMLSSPEQLRETIALAFDGQGGEDLVVKYPSWTLFHQDALMTVWRACQLTGSSHLDLPGERFTFSMVLKRY